MPSGFELTDEMNHCDIFISVLYDKIVPLDYLRHLKGAFNFHPGILPEYRGAATFSWAIINGEEEVGITLHEIDEGIDSGDIIAIRRFPIEETAEKTFSTAENVIFAMFCEWLPKLLEGPITASAQDESRARIYYRKDLDKVKDVSRIVRALTFAGKDNAFFIDGHGDKIDLKYYG